MTPKFKPGELVHHVCHREFDNPFKILSAGIMEDENGIKEPCYTVAILTPTPHRLFISENELKPNKENT